MATLVSAQLRAIADAVVNKSGYSSAVLSGIVPDARHLDRGGYHCSVEDLRKYHNQDDYSNTRPDDRNFNVKYGAAVDVTLSTADMVKHYKRVHAVWKDKTDPRRKYLNCVNTWDGSGDAVRLDFVSGVAKYASPDHRWHFHAEVRRRYLLDPKAARAVISVFAGEGKATWIAREEKPAVAPKPPVVTGKIPAPVKPVLKPPAKVHERGSRVLQYVPGKKVMSGEDCAFVQRFIGSARAGTPDGVFGARTRAAVKWYQQLRGLKADGVVGVATFKAMGVKASF